MHSRVFWLRIGYWVGAVLDGIMVIPMAYPPLFLWGIGLSESDLGSGYEYLLWQGAPLMLGWTCLLIWADRRPLERRFVMLLTVFPVVFGLVAGEIAAVALDFVAVERMIPIWVLQTLITVLFSYGYFGTRAIAKQEAGGA